jgi:hypothetical protein
MLLLAFSIAGGSLAFAGTTGIRITKVQPNKITPARGQSASITYVTGVVYKSSITVRNQRGAVVRTLARYSKWGSNTRTVKWDGRDEKGRVVPNGQYTVVIEGKTDKGKALNPARGAVTVTGNNKLSFPRPAPTPAPQPAPAPAPAPAPTPGPVYGSGNELGQTIEGAGSSNFAWLKYPGRKLGIAFQAPKSGGIKQITLQWKSSSGYGAGNYGAYNFELHANGSGNYPSGSVIGRASGIKPRTAMGGYADGAFSFPITASLTAGRIYHLVVTNVDPNPGANWSSPNGLMSRVQAWNGTGNRAAVYKNGAWKPWSSKDNPWNTAGSNYVNGQHIPAMLTWSDGSITGDPYYSAALSSGARFAGSSRAGQYIVWNGPDTTVRRIGLSVKRSGSPGGALLYHLEKVGGSKLATGTLATAAQVGMRSQSWVYATLSQPATLTRGASYRLWFESPTSGSGYYFTAPVYGENRPASWLEAGWGGTASHFIRGSGSGWSSMKTADLSFSLQ